MPRSCSASDLFASLTLGLVALAAVGAVGCGGERPMTSRRVQSAITVENALTANALTANALTANALTANALTANALTANALTANALTANALRDPLSRELLKYVVSCALDEDDELSIRIDGKRTSSRGALGLAPEWGKNATAPATASASAGCRPACWRASTRRRQAHDLHPRRQPGAAPGRQGAAPLHRPRGDVLRQPVHPQPAALPLPVARARPATNACAAIRSTTAR